MSTHADTSSEDLDGRRDDLADRRTGHRTERGQRRGVQLAGGARRQDAAGKDRQHPESAGFLGTGDQHGVGEVLRAVAVQCVAGPLCAGQCVDERRLAGLQPSDDDEPRWRPQGRTDRVRVVDEVATDRRQSVQTAKSTSSIMT